MIKEQLHKSDTLKALVEKQFNCVVDADKSGAIIDFLDDAGARAVSIRIFNGDSTYQLLSVSRLSTMPRGDLCRVMHHWGRFVGLFRLAKRK